MSPFPLDLARRAIARSVRALRTQRGFTQTEVAQVLGLTQNNFSMRERGHWSFTAEQLFALAWLFNVPPGSFTSVGPDDRDGARGALLDRGAPHVLRGCNGALLERLPPDDKDDDEPGGPHAVVRAVLLSPESRGQLAALAPVLLIYAEVLDLPRLRDELRARHRERRLGFLVEGVAAALSAELDAQRTAPRDPALDPDLNLAQRRGYQRCVLCLRNFLSQHLPAPKRAERADLLEDLLDGDIKTRSELEAACEDRAPLAERWGVVTRLTTDDLVRALRAARAEPTGTLGRRPLHERSVGRRTRKALNLPEAEALR